MLNGNRPDLFKAIAYTYDDHGWQAKVTSTATLMGTVVNDIAFTYDELGRVKKSQQDHSTTVSGSSPDVDYTYDMTATSNVITHGGRLKQVTYPGPASRRDVYYNLPASGIGHDISRPDNIADDASGTTKYAQFAYMGSGRITAEKHPAVTNGLDLTYGTGGTTYGGFDRFGRVKDQKWQNGTPTVKDQFKYAYDPASNRISREVAPDGDNPSGFDEYYLYDGLNRLKKMNRGNLASGTITDATAGYSHAWASWNAGASQWDTELDAVGNWKKFKIDDNGGGAADAGWSLSQSREHNVVNEIDDDDDHTNDPDASITVTTGTNWIDPKYDANGNMLSGPKPGAEGATEHHYLYDAWNRLKVVYIDGNSDDVWDEGAPDTLVAEYEYDGLHRRVRKTVAGESALDYYYNTNWQVIEVHEGDDKVYPLKQYVWSPRYIDAPVLRIRDEGTDGQNIETLYYCNDANMNVTALIDTSGAVVERYRYDPYGAVTVLNADYSDDEGNASDVDNEILYCGYRHHPETGLYHVRNRYHHPTLGRWITRDPKDATLPGGGYHDGMNLYEYVRSSPIELTDPMGLGFWADLAWEMMNRPVGYVGGPPPSAEQWKEYHAASAARRIAAKEAGGFEYMQIETKGHFFFKTEDCCPEEVGMLKKAAASAINTLGDVSDALYNYIERDSSTWTGEQDKVRLQFNRFFNQRFKGDLDHPSVWGVQERFHRAYKAASGPGGVTFICKPKGYKYCTSGVLAYRWSGGRPKVIRICKEFSEREDITDQDRAETVMHEWLHIHGRSVEDNDEKAYIRKMPKVGKLPQYQVKDVLGKWNDVEPPDTDLHLDASTLSMFGMNWHRPAPAR